MQRNAYHKRRRRWPMLSKWRKKGRSWPRDLGEKITWFFWTWFETRLIAMYIQCLPWLRIKSGQSPSSLTSKFGLSFSGPMDNSKPFLTLYCDSWPSEFRSCVISLFIEDTTLLQLPHALSSASLLNPSRKRCLSSRSSPDKCGGTSGVVNFPDHNAPSTHCQKSRSVDHFCQLYIWLPCAKRRSKAARRLSTTLKLRVAKILLIWSKFAAKASYGAPALWSRLLATIQCASGWCPWFNAYSNQYVVSTDFYVYSLSQLQRKYPVC